MNGQLELRIITQPYSAVQWGYFRRLVFENSLTKHIKLSSFSYSVVIFFLPISHIPPCFHAPDFPRLIVPVYTTKLNHVESTCILWSSPTCPMQTEKWTCDHYDTNLSWIHLYIVLGINPPSYILVTSGAI